MRIIYSFSWTTARIVARMFQARPGKYRRIEKLEMIKAISLFAFDLIEMQTRKFVKR